MTLGEKQRLFAQLIANLIIWAKTQGMDVAIGEVLRSDEQAAINAMGKAGRERVAAMVQTAFPHFAATLLNNTGDGISPSIHERKLAADLLLFINGIYQTQTEAYRPLGVKWESMHPLCCWGGRFKDGNHFSITDGGLK